MGIIRPGREASLSSLRGWVLIAEEVINAAISEIDRMAIANAYLSVKATQKRAGEIKDVSIESRVRKTIDELRTQNITFKKILEARLNSLTQLKEENSRLTADLAARNSNEATLKESIKHYEVLLGVVEMAELGNRFEGV